MSWLRKFDPIFTYRNTMRKMDPYKAQKYLSLTRMAYFFSATTLVMTVVYFDMQHKKLEEEKENLKKMEAGEPVIRDESEAHAALRKQGVEAGELYKYSPERGWYIVEYHRGEYLSKLQKQALEDAREAQRKALAEGRELPPDAILLVDESGSS